MAIKNDNYVSITRDEPAGDGKWRRKTTFIFFRTGISEEFAKARTQRTLDARLGRILSLAQHLEHDKRLQVTTWLPATKELASVAHVHEQSSAPADLPLDRIALDKAAHDWMLRASYGPHVSRGIVKSAKLLELGLVVWTRRKYAGERLYRLTVRGEDWLTLQTRKVA